MSIEAKIVADSISGKSPRITTFELRYPRFIHAEFMTHRMFSRNASSSRAIPVERQIAAIIEDTAMPVHWGMNQKGMQADKECTNLVQIAGSDGYEILHAEQAWKEARDRAIGVAEAFVAAGYHKQIVNRILEPFSHIKVVCTATNYENFFQLRSHKDAQPEIKVLSDLMRAAYAASNPRHLSADDWHLPYVTDAELNYVQSPENLVHDAVPMTVDDLIKSSVARCARVSYKTHDGAPTTVAADIALYDRLLGSVPLHASPAEHQAKPDALAYVEDAAGGMPVIGWENPNMSGNFDEGWIQFRKTLDNEAVHTPQLGC